MNNYETMENNHSVLYTVNKNKYMPPKWFFYQFWLEILQKSITQP